MDIPREILERVGRVRAYHQATRLPGAGDSSASSISGAAAAPQPNPFRIFEGYPRVVLPTKLISASAPTIPLLLDGLEALPISQVHPPHDIATLAAWLYQAAGVMHRIRGSSSWMRTYSTEGLVYPCEIYIAAFAIDGLEPGLYHFSVREFALRKLRDGPETLMHLKRGRPDLDFLKNTPGCLLVSTIFCRSSWKSHRRGYRHAICDTGHLLQNLWTVATGLGIQGLVRLSVHAPSLRELIGVPADADFADAESVQTMIIWADSVDKPMDPTGPTFLPGQMPTLPRPRLADKIVGYGSILAVHEDCVAPGVAVRDVRPPLTELSPLSQDFPVEKFPDNDPDVRGQPLGRVLLNYTPPRSFIRAAISRQMLATLNRVAFRWGSAFPLYPNGPHVALVRPFWIVHEVAGIEPGLWYYNPQKDAWSSLREGAFRYEAQQLAMGNPLFGNASAACFMVANLHRLLSDVGPDLYRLSHLEAGSCAQRLNLAATSVNLGCALSGNFRDEDTRRFLGLEKTGWEVLFATAVGMVPEPETQAATPPIPNDIDIWRD